MDRTLEFHILELDDINVGYSDGVFKLVSLLDKPIFHDVNKSLEAIARKGLNDYPLKFIVTDNPFQNAVQANNAFRASIGNINLIFTAAHFNDKNTVFCFLWEELDEQSAQDGQNKH